jgi:hypothetical protein
MYMRMGVRLTRRVAWRVIVRMIFVVHVRMGVRQRLVNVLVFASFSHMKPDTQRHQQACDNELAGQGFVEHGYRNCSAEERSN